MNARQTDRNTLVWPAPAAHRRGLAELMGEPPGTALGRPGRWLRIVLTNTGLAVDLSITDNHRPGRPTTPHLPSVGMAERVTGADHIAWYDTTITSTGDQQSVRQRNQVFTRRRTRLYSPRRRSA